jgi:hypothetical protein
MSVGAIVWCTISVTLSVLGTKVEDYETAALGKIVKIEPEYVYVDFSEYAKKQQYIGQYYYVKVKDYMCVEK